MKKIKIGEKRTLKIIEYLNVNITIRYLPKREIRIDMKKTSMKETIKNAIYATNYMLEATH